MDVSKNRGGPPKWMVYFMENPIKMDDLEVPLFLETHTWTILGFLGFYVVSIIFGGDTRWTSLVSCCIYRFSLWKWVWINENVLRNLARIYRAKDHGACTYVDGNSGNES